MTLDELLSKLVPCEHISVSHGVECTAIYEGKVENVSKIISTSIYDVVTFASYPIGTTSMIKIIVR